MHYTEKTAIQNEISGTNNGVKRKEERLCSILSTEVDIPGSWMENYVNQTLWGDKWLNPNIDLNP